MTACPKVCRGQRGGSGLLGRCLVLAGCCLAGTGCGQSNLVEVSGKVTFDGKLVPAGRIYFTPDTTRGNDGPQGYADIRDGKYDTRGTDCKAAWPGPTIVTIRGCDGTPGPSPNWKGNPLFAEHQVPIELTGPRSTQDFDVPAAAAEGLPKKTRTGRGP